MTPRQAVYAALLVALPLAWFVVAVIWPHASGLAIFVGIVWALYAYLEYRWGDVF